MNYESLLLEGSELKTSKNMQLYHDELKKKVKIAMDIASEARKKGFDPKKEVEIIIAQDVASRTEGLVGPKGVAKRLREMEDKGYTKDQIILSITKDICERKFSNDEL
jgi:DNA polymerase II large subunit